MPQSPQSSSSDAWGKITAAGAMGLAIQISQRRCQVPRWSGSLGLVSLSEMTSLSEQPSTWARASGERSAPGACTHTIVMDAVMTQISSSWGCTLQGIVLAGSTLRGGFSASSQFRRSSEVRRKCQGEGQNQSPQERLYEGCLEHQGLISPKPPPLGWG